MSFLARLLDDPTSERCGLCDNCTGERADRTLPVESIADAERFLLKRPIELVGKKQGLPADERIEQGRVLAMWGDAGWGALVKHGKQQTGRFDDRLVRALGDVIADWHPNPPPCWLTAVPSLRHPELVDDVAERLAARLDLPYQRCIRKIEERPAQKEQQNAVHQRQNVDGAFVIDGHVPATPVLLVDDIVDSGWTMTEVGRLLRRAGAGAVYPVALASSTGRD